MNKHELRKLSKEELKKHKDSFADFNSSLSSNLKSLFSELNVIGMNQTIGGYVPFQEEPVWFCEFKEEDFFYSLVHMHDEVKLSYHPIAYERILSGECDLKLNENDLRESCTPDIILIPGLAFTRQLDRLGRGKGYFDSFLKGFKGIKVGVFYSIQEAENVYCEGHDEKLDYIVTNKEIIRGI